MLGEGGRASHVREALWAHEDRQSLILWKQNTKPGTELPNPFNKRPCVFYFILISTLT